MSNPVNPVIPGGSTPANLVLDTSGVLMVVSAVLVLLTVVTFVSTGSFLATLVVIAILIGFILLLTKLGILNIYYADGMLHIDYHSLDGSSGSTAEVNGKSTSGSSPAPAPSTTEQTASAPKNIAQSEVFHVGNNQYSYDDAPAVCAAYDAELATYDQVNASFATGAEWCAYGWSQGGMALYPTQQATWQKLQMEPKTRTACGRPGVNGGYFDPATKFGVNCYGPKPADLANRKYPLPLPGADTASFNAMVDRFRKMLGSIPVTAFNRLGWSEWNLVPRT